MKKKNLIKKSRVVLPLCLLFAGSVVFAGGASSAVKIASMMVDNVATSINRVVMMSPAKYTSHARASLKMNDSLSVVQSGQGNSLGNLVKSSYDAPFQQEGRRLLMEYGLVAKDVRVFRNSVDDFMTKFDQEDLSLFADLIPSRALEIVGANPRIIIETQEQALGFATRLNFSVRVTGDNVSGTGLMGIPSVTLSNDDAVLILLRVLSRDGIVVGKQAVQTGARGL